MLSASEADENPLVVAVPQLVGRDREIAALTDALARPPALVLIEGEAGIGKSRLLHEVLAAAAPSTRHALRAVCPPLRESLTLGPVVDALHVARPSVAGIGLTDLAGALRPLFPEWSDDLPPSPDPLDDAKAARHRLFRALAELIDAIAVDVLVIEDAHWADEVTLEFLLFLASRQHAPAMNVVVTYRPDEVDDQSLLLRLSSRPPARGTLVRIALSPLDQDDTATLVSSMLDGKPMSAEFAAFMHERTDGVPLAVEESVRLLCDRADVVFRGGEWVRLSLSELQVPPTVRDSARERVGRLGPAAQRVLDAAATLVEPSSETVLGATTGLGPQEFKAGLSEAANAGLLDADERGRWRFRHVLTATAVYEAIAPPERQALHRRAGRALAGTEPPPVAQLARHFREAGVTKLWARFGEQAAQRAVASGDHTTAVVVLDELLAGVELPALDRARIARTAGLAALGRREPVDELQHRLVATLRSVLDSPGLTDRQQAEIRNPLGRLLINVGEAEAALSELEQAVAHLDHDPVEAARTMTYLGWAYAGPWPASTHLRWLQRAAELTPRIHSAADRLSLEGNRAAALLMLGEADAWNVVAGLPTDGASAAERLDVARINANIGTGALLWGRYADARRHLAAARKLAEADRMVRLHRNILLEQANLDWFTGQWEGLEQRANELAQADRDRPSLYLASIRLAARLAAAAGRRRAADEQFSVVLDEAARLGALDTTMEPAAALARRWLADGQPARALQVTDQPMATVHTKGIWIWASDIAPVRVEAYLAAGEPDRAARVTDEFAQGLQGRHAPAPQAALQVCQALMVAAAGDNARASHGFDRAATAWDALPRPYDALLARERQAEALLGDGQNEAGQKLLAQVYEQLFRLGARGDADRIAQRLRDLGSDVPRLWRGGRRGYGDRLSPRELEVVRLVVAGQTNREIARVLAKSPATVDQQLRSAMRKLNVSSRTALAVAAVEAGVFAEEAP